VGDNQSVEALEAEVKNGRGLIDVSSFSLFSPLYRGMGLFCFSGEKAGTLLTQWEIT
jgi:hypothetical protein